MSVLPFVHRHPTTVGAVALTRAMRRLLTLLPLLLTAMGCAESGPGNVRTVAPGTPETLVDVCSSCSNDCVMSHRKQCIESKVHSEKAKSGGCLVYCVGKPEKGMQQGDWR